MSRPHRRRRKRLPLPQRPQEERGPLCMVARRGVVGDGQEGIAQLIAEALDMALEEVTSSDQPWEPGWVLLVAGDHQLGDELVAMIMPAEVVVERCFWLDDHQRSLVAARLPIDERRVVLYIYGYSATVKYFVPDGTTSN